MRNRPTKEQFQRQLEHMVRTIRNDIIEGRYTPGQYLPSEKALVATFGMSNNSIRTGLEQLVQEGWIVKVPRVGNRVAAARPRVNLKLVCNEMPLRNLALERLLEQFHRQYPWIAVETVLTSDTPGFEYANAQTLSGDLALLENFQFQYVAESGRIKLLEEQDWNPELFPQASRTFAYEGKLYMQPLIFSPIVLCYNKEHFRECGMLEPDGSWTWDDLMRAAEKLSDGKGRYGFCFHVPSKNRWPLFLLQSGEKFQWEGSRLKNIRNTKLLESMAVCKRILHNRKAFPLYLSENHFDIDRMFLEGKVSMTLSSYMGMNGWKGADNYDISPVPVMEEMRTLVISLGIGINRDTPHKEEARLLVDYLTSTDAQKLIRQWTVSIPSLGAALAEPVEAEGYRPTRFMMFREIMSSLRMHSDLNLSHRSLPVLERELKAYWADLLDEDELCDRLSNALSKDTARLSNGGVET